MKVKPTINQVKTIFSGKVFKIQAVDLVFSNGQKRCYERIEGNAAGAVLVLPIFQGNLVMIREYAVGRDHYELGFVKGAIDAGEDLLEAANRELQEEAGYRADRLTLLRVVSTSPSYMTGQMHIVLAEELYPKQSKGDEPESLEVIHWPLDRLDELPDENYLTDARSIASIYLLKNHLNRRKKS